MFLITLTGRPLEPFVVVVVVVGTSSAFGMVSLVDRHCSTLCHDLMARLLSSKHDPPSDSGCRKKAMYRERAT